MLDLVSFSPFVSHEDTYNYLSFSAETAVAAFIFHGQWFAVSFGLWLLLSKIKDDVTKVLEFVRDNIGPDFTSYIDTVDSVLTIASVGTAILTTQNIVNFTLSKLGSSVAEDAVAQTIGFGTTIIDGIILIAA